jgi:hypothetical protein
MNRHNTIAKLLAAGAALSMALTPAIAMAKKPKRSALQEVMHTDVGALMGSKFQDTYSQSEEKSSKKEERKTPYGRIKGFGIVGNIGIPRLIRKKKPRRIFLPLVTGNMRYRPFCMDEVFDEFEPYVKSGCKAIQQSSKKSESYVAKCVDQVQDKCIEKLDGGKPKSVAINYAKCIGAELSRQSLSTGTNANIKMTPGSSFHNMERYCRLK